MNPRPVNGLIAVVRQSSAEAGRFVARSFLEAGLDLVEVTLTTPGALDLISEFEGSGARLGAGTVLDADQARACLAAGASFLVSPVLDVDVAAIARDEGVDYVPGATTPGEVHAALRQGAEVVKVFPVDVMGGADYIRTLRAPFPQLRTVVSGGVDVADFAEYLAAGAEGICVGAELLDSVALEEHDLQRQVAHVARVRELFESVLATHPETKELP